MLCATFTISFHVHSGSSTYQIPAFSRSQSSSLSTTKYRSRNRLATKSDTASLLQSDTSCLQRDNARVAKMCFKMSSAVIASNPWLFYLVILSWVSWSCRILAHVGLLNRHPVARVGRRRCRSLWAGAVVLHGLAGVRTRCSHPGAILLPWESL